MQIDFYILDAESRQKSLFFACELLEKIPQRLSNDAERSNYRWVALVYKMIACPQHLSS
jgi:hypothetical protein